MASLSSLSFLENQDSNDVQFDMSEFLLDEEELQFHVAVGADDDNGASERNTIKSNNKNSIKVQAKVRVESERVAFRIRSEHEFLDDGYKWRKYGRKMVKDNPNPRNYFRCSTKGCRVKKIVERDREDGSYVITCYQGKHNHYLPPTNMTNLSLDVRSTYLMQSGSL